MLRILLIAAGLLAASAFSVAPASAHPEVDARNRVSFQVEALREIANDWATARLSVIVEGKDPAVVATTVNQKMAAALKTAQRAKGVESRSGAYTTHPVYDDGRVVRWRAQQELRVESANVDRLAKLIGDLQGESVLLSGIQFSVQRETRTKLEDALIAEALASFRSRAKGIAMGMGSKDWSLVSLSVGHSGGQPRMVHMRAESDMLSRASAKVAPPAFEAGTSDIRVQISGSVELE